MIIAVVALGGLIALVWLVSEGLAAQAPWPLVSRVLWLTGCLVLLCGDAAVVLMLAGGLICLHRDALETRGLPYAPRRPREWRAGPVVRGIRAALRALGAIKGRRPGQLELRPGELVEVRQLDEILETLDDRGTRDSLPFSPEMAALCGRQARVLRRVDKVYDWIFRTGLRRMQDTVFLEGSRCDGSAHCGCQADCQMLWKEVWLQRPATRRERPAASVTTSAPQLDLYRLTQRVDAKAAEPLFVCQMTQLPSATTPLSWRDPRHYLRDLLTGNVRAGPFVVGIAIVLFNSAQRRSGGVRFPMRCPGKSRKSPHAVLDMKPGELVRIKSKREIESTLDADFRNWGLWFDPEMVRFCGGEHRVLMRVNRQIDEKSGKMITFTNPCIVLEGVTATGEYKAFALLNERIYWREIWLERVPAEPAQVSCLAREVPAHNGRSVSS